MRGFFKWLAGGMVSLSLLLLVATGALAGRMALLPLADLSKGANSINLPLTQRLYRELEKRGFDLVPEGKVLSFMVEHRIRWTGYLDRFHVLEMNRELGADLVLMGSITQWGGASDSVGMVLYLVKAKGYRLVWSRVVALSRQDVRRVLGLGEARTAQDLLPKVLDRLLATLPNGVKRYAGVVPLCDLAGAFISPRYARSGEEMSCSVKLRCMGGLPTSLYLKMEGVGHLLPMKFSRGRYVATWKAPSREGRYPVSLVMEWNHGSNRKREIFLTSFWVDDHPPKFSLELKKGVKLGKEVLFRHHIVLVPRFMHPEPLSRWSIQVVDKDGYPVVNEHGEGNLPQVLVWKGEMSGGGVAKDGKYTVILKVWDRAGNEASVSREVVLKRTPPRVVVEALQDEKGVRIKVEKEGKEVPLAYWRLVVKNGQGKVLKEVEGEKLPFSTELPIQDSEGLVCTLEARDVLGNRAELVDRKLKVITMQEKREKKGGWVENF